MKDKICLPKKIVQIFCLLFLIIGFFILANFINRTFLLSQNALAGRITTIPTPIKKDRPPECINNPHKDCLQGEIMIYKSGFCSCVTDTPSLPINQVNKRCVYENNTSPTVIYPSRVEEYKNGSWQSVENCPSSKICDLITLKCITSISKPLTGKKIPGSTCRLGLECQSGICDSRYMTPQGQYAFLLEKKCTYSLAEQKKFFDKKLQNDRSTLGVGATTTVVILIAPIAGDTVLLAAKSGIPTAAYYFLQQPVVQKALDIINIGGTAFSINDCVQNGAGGDLCTLYLLGVSINPGEASQALGNSLKNIFIKPSASTFSRYVIGKKPLSKDLKLLEQKYGVKIIISDSPFHDTTKGYILATTDNNKIILYPYPNKQGLMEYDLLAPIHQIGSAAGRGGHISITTMQDTFASNCIQCRQKVNALLSRGLSYQSEEVVAELNLLNKNAWLFRQDAANSLGLFNINGQLVSGKALGLNYDRVLRDPGLLQYLSIIDDGNFSVNLANILNSLGYK